jgi:hypothetical protein
MSADDVAVEVQHSHFFPHIALYSRQHAVGVGWLSNGTSHKWMDINWHPAAHHQLGKHCLPDSPMALMLWLDW